MKRYTMEAAVEAGACARGVLNFVKAAGLDPKGAYTTDEIVAAARKAGPCWLGMVACYAPGLNAEQRIAIARESGQHWLYRVARRVPGLSPGQRIEIGRELGPDALYLIASFAPGLSVDQRDRLRHEARQAVAPRALL